MAKTRECCSALSLKRMTCMSASTKASNFGLHVSFQSLWSSLRRCSTRQLFPLQRVTQQKLFPAVIHLVYKIISLLVTQLFACLKSSRILQCLFHPHLLCIQVARKRMRRVCNSALNISRTCTVRYERVLN